MSKIQNWNVAIQEEIQEEQIVISIRTEAGQKTIVIQPPHAFSRLSEHEKFIEYYQIFFKNELEAAREKRMK